MLALPRHRARPARDTSTRRLLATVLAVEAVYALAIAAAVPHGAGAVGMVIAIMCAFAMAIQARGH